jgi:ligand-binding SRPBCC domain-containing protein
LLRNRYNLEVAAWSHEVHLQIDLPSSLAADLIHGALVFVRPSYRLRVTTRYRVPAEQVWAHVTDVQAISAEFPPWAPFHFTRPDDVAHALKDGARTARIPARLGVLPWTAEVNLIEPGRSYEDLGDTGLFSVFLHIHTVEAVSDGTLRLDDVWFTPTYLPAFFARWTSRLFVARHRRAAKVLSADARTVGHCILREVFEDEDLPATIA